MTPLLVVTWTRTPAPPEVAPFRAWVASLPPDRRDRVVLRWGRAGVSALCGMALAARDAGFRRIRAERLDGGAPSDREVAVLVQSGVNEIAFDAVSAPRPEVVTALRARALLAHVTLIVCDGRLARALENRWHADELEVRVAPHDPEVDQEAIVAGVDAFVARAAARFRRVAVRGLALCRLPSLDPDRVVSNALVVRAPEGVLELKFQDPERVFFDACRSCRLSLACDGFAWNEFVRREGPRVQVRPFGKGRARTVTLDAAGLARRDHPPTFLSGRVHLLAVAEGVRPAGRVAVNPADLAGQVALIREAGLAHEIVEDPPPDQDRAGAGEVHVFFARDAATARRVADLERAFVRAERGPDPMGAAVFAREMGRALGYPRCCIEAFVAAGPDATLDDLHRQAHARSRAFWWPLNCLDPASPFRLIPHVPCRFDCEASLAMAQAVAARLDRLFPGLRGTAETLLSRLVLVLGSGRAVAWTVDEGEDATAVNLRCVDRIGPPWRGRSKMWEAVVQCGRVHVSWRGLDIMTYDEEVHRFWLREPPLLFPFGPMAGQPTRTP